MSRIRNKDSTLDSPSCAKTTPLKMGTISKALLTPCRRVGLCRTVFKTTPPTITSSYLFNTPNTDSPDPNSTSVSVIDKSLTDKSASKVKNRKITRAKKSLNLEQESKVVNEVAVTRDCAVSPTILNDVNVINSDVFNCSSEKGVQLEVNGTIQIKAHAESKSNQNESENYSKDANTNKARKRVLKKKRFTKCLSMKRAASSSDATSDLEDSSYTNLSTCVTDQFTVDCELNSELDDANEVINTVSKKSIKRKIISSSDEDDFVSSQNSSTGTTNDWGKRVAELKQGIQVKKTELNRLEQAAIYKNLHNVDELNKLTETWRNGCHDALRYLLVKLQTHGPMDMLTLLQNLHIPKELVDFNTDNDSFI